MITIHRFLFTDYYLPITEEEVVGAALYAESFRRDDSPGYIQHSEVALEVSTSPINWNLATETYKAYRITIAVGTAIEYRQTVVYLTSVSTVAENRNLFSLI